MRILRPLSRPVARVLAGVAAAAWLVTMGALVNHSYLQGPSSLAADLTRYGSDAQWYGVYFMVASVLLIAVIIVLLGWPTSMYLLQRSRRLETGEQLWTCMGMCFTAAAALRLATW